MLVVVLGLGSIAAPAECGNCMALVLAACLPLCVRQWILEEMQLLSFSVVPADRGCANAADEGCGIVSVPVLRVRIAHEPVCGLCRCEPLMND